MNCSFCNKEFKSTSSLNYHQKTAKYCLEIQGKGLSEYKCDHCDKIFSTKYTLSSHIDICKEQEKEREKEIYKEVEIEKYKLLLSERDNMIKSLEKQISELNHTIAEIAKQPKNTTNNIKTQNNQNNQNIQNILTDYKTYEEYTSKDRILSLAKDNNIEDYFWKGQRGVAEFVYDRIAKTENGQMIICCTDPSRNRFKYKNESNGISEDIDAHLFHKKISDPIKKIYNDVHSNIQKDYYWK